MSRGGVSLNIRNPEAHRPAEAIAGITGEKLTSAVTEALRERYERLQARSTKAPLEELRAIGRRTAALVKGPYLDHADLLYDERGLQRGLLIPPHWRRSFTASRKGISMLLRR